MSFIFQPDWYRGMEYPKEQERGYASNEDLYVPGWFEMQIKKGESIVFAASTSKIRTSTLKKLLRLKCRRETHATISSTAS